MIIVFQTFILLMVYYVDWFSYIKWSLHSSDKLHLVMVYTPSYILLNAVCYFLHQYLSKVLGCNFFIVISLSGLDSRVMLATYNDLGSVPTSSAFWKSLRSIGINSLNSTAYQGSHLILGLFFVENFFFLNNSISILVTGLLRFFCFLLSLFWKFMCF